MQNIRDRNSLFVVQRRVNRRGERRCVIGSVILRLILSLILVLSLSLILILGLSLRLISLCMLSALRRCCCGGVDGRLQKQRRRGHSVGKQDGLDIHQHCADGRSEQQQCSQHHQKRRASVREAHVEALALQEGGGERHATAAVAAVAAAAGIGHHDGR